MEIKIIRHSIEPVQHNLSCKCLRRREVIEVNGEIWPMEYTVKSHDDPPTPIETIKSMYEARLKHLNSRN